ncbi:hypothetical protein M728_005622 (plasmid) [Ensifer sp. WSM1721]
MCHGTEAGSFTLFHAGRARGIVHNPALLANVLTAPPQLQKDRVDPMPRGFGSARVAVQRIGCPCRGWPLASPPRPRICGVNCAIHASAKAFSRGRHRSAAPMPRKPNSPPSAVVASRISGIGTIPLRLGQHFAKTTPLRIVELPLATPAFAKALQWPALHNSDPAASGHARWCSRPPVCPRLHRAGRMRVAAYHRNCYRSLRSVKAPQRC